MARPVKYKTPGEMQIIIDEYFLQCEQSWLGDKKRGEHPTVTGLAVALDLTRQGLLEYCEKSDQFSDTIKAAKAKVEAYIEQRLFDSNATGCIFNLKNNFGWKDKSETEMSTPPGRPFEVKNTKEMTEAEIDARLAELEHKAGKAGSAGGKAQPKGKKKP